MKKNLLFLAAMMLSVMLSAQTQQGYVRTLGRPDKAGQPLSGVTIRTKGSHNTVLSDDEGNFALQLTGKTNGDAYSLQQVRKNGYELNEIDLVGRQLTYSDKVPLILVMVSSEQLQADKARIEASAYTMAEKNFNAQTQQLKEQLRDSILTIAKYQQAINDLQDKFEKYQLLIDGMAEHYAHTDYDNLDSLDREINLCIENGDLERADSLINTLFNPIGVLQRNMDALASLEQQIGQARGLINQANEDMAAVLKQQEKDAEYLYQLYTIATARFDYEKALQYIETRAQLDTTRWEWQFDAAQLFFNQNQTDKAEVYYNRALDLIDEILIEATGSASENTNIDDMSQIIVLTSMTYTIENNLAVIYSKTNRLKESEELFLDVIDFYKGYVEYISNPEVAIGMFGDMVVHSMMGLSEVYRKTNRFEESEALSNEAMEIMQHLNSADSFEEKEKAKAQALNNKGVTYKNQRKYKESEKCLKEALEIHRRIAKTNPDNETEVARTLHNYANLCKDIKRYKESEAMYTEGIKIYERLAKDNPKTYEIKLASIKSDFANLYRDTERFQESESLYKEALKIKRKFVQLHPELFELELALTLGNFGSLYIHTQQYNEAVPLLEEALEIFQRLHEQNPDTYAEKLSVSKFNLASAYYKSGQIKESLPFWVEILDEIGKLAKDNPDIYKETYETTLDFIKELAPWLVDEANDFKDEGKYEEGETYYKSALDMYRWLAKSDPNTYQSKIAGLLNGLAILYANTKQFSESEAAFKESFELYQQLAKANSAKYESLVTQGQNNLEVLASLLIKATGHNKEMYRHAENKTLLSQAVGIYRYLAQNTSSKYETKIAATLGSYAYNCLFTQDWKEAEQTAREALSIDSTQFWINANLAAGLLFQGKYSEAESICIQYKDHLKNGLPSGFDDLNAAGLIPKEHLAEVEHVKELLK